MLLLLPCTYHSNYIVKAEPLQGQSWMHQMVIATLYQHRAQSCTQTEEALKEWHIQYILHDMFQQMQIYGQSCVLARSWQLLQG